ncbi:MAG: ABC transporter substrate-binding protein [Chloroflexi bacterium]|nr:ABC transporter substrate-binding protein [Chloroflexota bacterium]
MQFDSRGSIPSVISRRSALRMLGALGGVTLAAACGPSVPSAAPTGASGGAAPPALTAPAAAPTGATAAAPAPAAAPTTQPAPTGAPKTGGTLRVAISADPASLDGHLYAAGRFDTTWLIYDRLTEYDLNLKPQPMLAESWDVSSDYKSIKLNLRKGVTFHDGREFTSDDVKYNFLRVRDPKVGAGAFVNQSNWFTSFDTPDKNTIVLNSDQPRPLVFDFFERLNMVDKNIMEGPDVKTRANGTGPFKFVEWIQGDHFSTEKNPSFWMAGRPYIDGVKTLILKDQQGAVAQFEGGQIDVFETMNLVDFLRLRKDPKYATVVNDVPTGMYCFGLNTTWAPLDNKMVRQGLNYAINRQRWVEGYFQDTSVPISLEWYRGTPMHDDARENFYAFDLDKAKSLLQQSGVGPFSMDMVLIVSPESTPLVQIYQADLASVGVTLNIVNMDLAAWLDNVNNRKYHGMYYSPAAIAASVGTELTTSKVWQIGNNNSGFDSPEYEQLGTATTTETDPTRLTALYKQVNDLMLDESFAIPLTWRPPSNLTRAAVHATNNFFGGWWYRDVWLDA